MLSNFLSFVNTKGSSLSLPAHGWVVARATSLLAAHFVLRNTASNSAEKKGGQSEQPIASEFEKSLSWSAWWPLNLDSYTIGYMTTGRRQTMLTLCALI